MTAVDFDLTASFLPEGGGGKCARCCILCLDDGYKTTFAFSVLHFAFLQFVDSVIKKQAQVICLNRSLVFIRTFTGQFLAGLYLIFVTGATGGARVNFFWPV